MKLSRFTGITQLLFALLFALTPLLSAVMPPARIAGHTFPGTSVAKAAGPNVTATKSDGVTAGVKKHPGDTISYTVQVSNTGTDAGGVSFTDPLDSNTTYVPGSLQSTPIARNDSYHATGNVRIQVPASSGILANDSDPDGDTLSSTTTSTARGGNLTLDANGGFTYNPPTGYEGDDSFTYSISDGHGHTDTATATINVSGMIWFINNAASSNGDGRLSSPFNSLSSFASINNGAGNNPASGDSILLYSGSGNYTGGLTLLNNQKLVGQGTSYSLSAIIGITPPQYSDPLPSTGGTKPTLSGNLTVGSGNTIEGLSLSDSGGTALSGSGFGTLTLRDMAISNSSGGAISLSNGTLDAFLTSVSSTGGTSGISLSNTTGSFTVTGDGSTSGSGGTIQNATGSGIVLSAASNVSLSWMNIKSNADDGITGSNVSGFSLDHSAVSGNGNTVSVDRGLDFGDRASNVTGLTGTASITNSTISASYEDGMRVRNGTGTLNLTVSNTTFDGSGVPYGNDGLQVMSDNSANINLKVSGSTFRYNRGDQFQFTSNDTATGTNNVTFQNNTLTGDRGSTYGGTTLGGGMTMNGGGSGYTKLLISGNTLTGAVDSAIKLNPGLSAGGRMDATVSNNTVGNPSVVDSGSAQADDIDVVAIDHGTLNALVTGNRVYQYANPYGILVRTGEGDASVNATVTSNTIANPGSFALQGFRVEAGTLTGDTGVVCADVGGPGAAANSLTGSGGSGATDMRAREGILTTAIRFPGYTGGPADTTAVSSYLSGRNGGASATASGSQFQNSGAGCTQPTDPTLPTTYTPTTPSTPTAPTALSNTPSYTPPASNVSTSGGTISMDIGMLPAGKSVTITYQASINNDIASATVSNRATISGSTFSNVLSDDPDTVAPGDATLTPISIPTTTTVSSSANPSVVGDPVTFTATVSTNSPATAVPTGSVQFKDNGSPIGATQTLDSNGVATYTTSSLAGGIHTITASFTGTGPFEDSSDTLFGDQEVDAPPSITAQPSDQAVVAGSSVSFSAAADGYPAPVVQWQVSTDNGGHWSDIAGATSRTYTFTARSSDDGNQYRAVFTNTYGGNNHTSTSNAATLTINVAPSVTLDPADQTVNAGSSASFTAAASGKPAPSVQWQVSTDGGASYSNIPGATGGTYAFTATVSDDGNKYRAVFTNSLGTATSSAATLTVQFAPSVKVNPTDQTVAASDTATFTATASGSPAPSVQWQVSVDGGTHWSDLSGETSTTLTLNNVTASQDGNQYRAVFTNSLGSDTTTAATLTVRYVPSISTQPSDQTVTAGDTASFTAGASGDPAPSVQWQVSTDNGVTWSDISGATSTTYSLTTSPSDDGSQYRAIFTNSLGSDTTKAATLTVHYAPSVTSQPSDATVNAGDPVSFTAKASGNPTPAVQWQVNTGSGWSDIAGATSATYTIAGATASQDGNQYRAVYTNTFGGSDYTATSSVATLTVHYAPRITTQPSNQTVDDGGTATFTATASGNPIPTVQWQVNTGSGWSDIAGATNTTYSFAAQTSDDGTQYRAVFTNSFGSATSDAATLHVGQSTATTLSSSDNPSVFGELVHFTATVAPQSRTGTPTGTVQFKLDGSPFGSEVALDSNGQAVSNDVSSLAVGTHTVSADYTPSTSSYKASSGTLSGGQTVNKASTTTILAAISTPQPYGKSITFTATVSARAPGSGAPTGSVTFYDNGTSLGTEPLSGDRASLSTSSLGVGSHTITASYSGDTNFTGSATATGRTFGVRATTTTLYNGGQIVIIGNTIKLSARVTSTASYCASRGTLAFTLDRNPTTGAAGTYKLASVAVSSGAASKSLATTGWVEGVYTVTATYTGPTGCAASSSDATLTVGSEGDSANGGGWTTVSGIGRLNFGFTVRKLSNTIWPRYKGQFVMINKGKWRLKGTLASFTRTSVNQGAVSGTGDLYWWNPTGNNGLGGWQLYRSGVGFTASFTDKSTKTSPDLYGQHINVTVSSTYPAMPNFSPIAIKGGNIKISRFVPYR